MISSVILVIFALTIVITPAFAELDLSNEKIVSTDDNLVLQFTDNTFKIFQTHTEIIPHLEFGIIDLGNVELFLDDARVNVLGSSFTIKNDSVVLYAKNIGDGKFRVNVYIFTNSGLQKTTFTANIIPPESAIIVPEIIQESVKEKYQPELIINSSHDFTTYWKDIFNIDVQAYDAHINPRATGFEGKIDGAIVNVILSIDDTNITLQGVTTNGNWDGEYYFPDNISKPGEYAVDIIVSYLDQTVSKSSSMFIIGTTTDSGSSPDRDFDNDGILNVDDACPNDPEDFGGAGEDIGPPPVGDGCPEP